MAFWSIEKLSKILITGIEGSAASYLAEYIAGLGESHEIHGTSRKIFSVPEYVTKVYQCDLCDFASVIQTLMAVQPDYIFHLAANADVKMSFTNPISVLNNNINNTAVILECLHTLGMNPVFQMCSTSEVYGNVSTYPITENYPLKPANIYAISKLTQEKLAQFYFDAYNLPVVITRAFGYINPKRKNIFSTAFAIQVARIEAGLQKPMIEHGNLESIRTLLDVRDIAKAYWLASQKAEYGTPYNIGSEVGVSVQTILHKLIDKSLNFITTQVKHELLRPNDVTLQIPSTAAFRKQTNFYPEYSLNESLDYLLKYCRENHAR